MFKSSSSGWKKMLSDGNLHPQKEIYHIGNGKYVYG